MNQPDPKGVRLCELDGFEECLHRYWLDPDGTLWSGIQIKKWWTTASGSDVYDIYTRRGRRSVTVSKLLRLAFGHPEPTRARSEYRNPLRVAAICPEGEAYMFRSAGSCARTLGYQSGDVARTARHNAHILNGSQTFSYKGIRRLRGWRVFLLDSLNKQNTQDYYALF